MTTLTSDIAVTLDGVTNFSVGVDDYEWSDHWLLFVDTFVMDDTGPYTASYSLSGSDWSIALMRFTGDVRAVIEDSEVGSGRRIETLGVYGMQGVNEITLAATFVETLKGSDGAEQLALGAAGAGMVELRGGDDVVETGSGYVFTLDLGGGANRLTMGAGGANIILSGIDADIIALGTAGDVEYLNTGRGDDEISTSTGWVGSIIAGRGRDEITLGAGGTDYLHAGRDADTVILKKQAEADAFLVIDGGENVSDRFNKDSDTLDMKAFSKSLDIDLDGPAIVDSGNGVFLIRNFENASGGSKSDSITGNGEANILRGNGGADKIAGLGGADDLYGGGGKDVFIFTALSDSPAAASRRDVIHDFASGDRIDLSDIDANSKAKGNQAFSFIGDDDFSRKAGQLRYDDDVIYGDVNGDRKVDFSLQVEDVASFSKGFFML
ncbi:M10 family metallopeptidase C-terminal domain-containing protein [Rhizobium sp. TRM95796]|uniref:M10 family metallopeptidase C-terminal domain-containing protein n=1 Tax=Rhizobium sp. TRM95796 TaxID=2979862 RepID=UPI0021E861B3|nr:M10 family metallopeptidase C-terminal domain-containing protein [Rhizobium sp. TRM95796]MCV3766717.1 M10 family metallopeptidase C-terminal domain-containing protein [Rhizobium sp. TRM95796]